MPYNQKNTVIRFAIIFTLIVLGFAAVVFKIVYTQYYPPERDALLELVEKKQVNRNDTIKPNRGNIYDCHGKLMAGSAPSYYLEMDTRVPYLRENNNAKFKLYIDSISDALSHHFGDRTAAEYKADITKGFLQEKKNLKLYPQRVTYSDLQAVLQMPLFNKGQFKSGLIPNERYERIKPYGLLASRTIGSIYGATGMGVSGLEKQYESYLHGINGIKRIEMIDGRVVYVEDQEPTNGLDVITTIDANLQDIVETQLMRSLDTLKGEWGTCILMEVKTGEVKAIANLGRHKDSKTDTYRCYEDKNYAVSKVEPGSTFKTFTLMAALDDNKIKLTDSIDAEHGYWVYTDPKHPIKDTHSYDHKITVKQALAASSNVALSKILISSYNANSEDFVKKLKKMGICDSVYFDIPGTQAPDIKPTNNQETFARMAFGYFVELPPIDILMFYNAIANNGKMIRPYLVKEIRDNGEVVQTFSTSTVAPSICKTSTLNQVKECLEAVVWDNDYGTASHNLSWAAKAQSQKVHIAGKTGTARVFENGHYLNDRHRITFCGYFPMEAPVYTCIFMIHKPQGSYDAGLNCGSAVRLIAEKAMAYKGRKNINNTTDDIKQPNSSKKTDVELLDTKHVPNVIGLGAKEAIYMVEQTGMIAITSGKGKVVKQSVAPSSSAIKGQKVYLELK